VTGTFFISP